MDRKYWIHKKETECPICGHCEVDRMRVYGEKPKDPAKRYEYEQVYDYCDAFYFD